MICCDVCPNTTGCFCPSGLVELGDHCVPQEFCPNGEPPNLILTRLCKCNTVTVLGSVCLCVCLSVVKPMECLFFLKTLSQRSKNLWGFA